MLSTESTKTFEQVDGRLIPCLNLPGPKQMAIDVMLLEKTLAKACSRPTARFYQWDQPWLSIGRNQMHLPRRWIQLAEAGQLQLVKRPSGGGAVLHGSGLTYALIWPAPPTKRKKAYQYTCQWLQKGFLELGLPLRQGQTSLNEFVSNCFATSAAADLVDEEGCKRIGSAQFWKKGILLQHGEILLNPPQELWEKIFDSPSPKPMPPEITHIGLSKVLKEALISCWPEITWTERALSDEEWNVVNKTSHQYTVQLLSHQST